MAVYTHLGAEELGRLIAHYDVGDLISAKGIAEGVSNSNWLIETRKQNSAPTQFILTMYERRIDVEELPFFLGLLDHLADKGCPVPRTIHDKNGATHRILDGKSVALIQYLPGVSVDHPTPEQAFSVGEALARVHLAGNDFEGVRAQGLGLNEWQRVLTDCGTDALAGIDPELPQICSDELQFLAENWPKTLPQGVVHCDLFPDNVLMLGETVSGLIDFYFAANDAFAYDLAVTHAAWCFERGTASFRGDISKALLRGYGSVRPLSQGEVNALPILARGASMRFISSRSDDWLNTPKDALVERKDPMDFAKRLKFYANTNPKTLADIF